MLWTLWLYRKRILLLVQLSPLILLVGKKPKQSTTKIFLSLRGYYWQPKKKTHKIPIFCKKIHYELRHQGGVWIPRFLCFRIAFFSLFFSLFFLAVNVDFSCEQCMGALFTGPTNITFHQFFH